MRRRISSTPYELGARFASICACGKPINKGDRIMYYPAAKKAECRECSYQTRCALADEELGMPLSF